MRSGTALLALHFQNEVLHPSGKIRLGVASDSPKRFAVIERVQRLLALARMATVPVISVRIAFRPDYSDVIQNCRIFRQVVGLGAMVEGSWGAEFYKGLEPLPGEFVVKHLRTNAFLGSRLDEHLRGISARHLIVAGIATNSTVEATVRHASDVGYDVVVASDACSCGDPDLHQASLRNMALVADVEAVEEIRLRLESPDGA